MKKSVLAVCMALGILIQFQIVNFADEMTYDITTFQNKAIEASNEIKTQDKKIVNYQKKYNTSLTDANGVGNTSTMDNVYKKYLTPMENLNELNLAKMNRLSMINNLKTQTLEAFFNINNQDIKIKRHMKTVQIAEKDLEKRKKEYEKGIISKWDYDNYVKKFSELSYETKKLNRDRLQLISKANKLIGLPLKQPLSITELPFEYTNTFNLDAVIANSIKYSKNIISKKYDYDEALYKYNLQIQYEANNTDALVEKHTAQLQLSNEYNNSYQASKITEEITIYGYSDDMDTATDNLDIALNNYEIETIKHNKSKILYNKGNMDLVAFLKSEDSFDEVAEALRVAKFERYKAIKTFEYYIESLANLAL